MLIPLNWEKLKHFFLEEQARLLKKIQQFGGEYFCVSLAVNLQLHAILEQARGVF